MEIKIDYQQYTELWKEIEDNYNKYLKKEGVKLPRKYSLKSYWLVALYYYFQKPVSSSDIYEWMIKMINDSREIAKDQQIRHLRMQDGFDVRIKGMSYQINHQSFKIKPGEYLLYSITEPSKDFGRWKRFYNLKAHNFAEIKQNYDFRCATCWHKENEIHPKTNKMIRLQKGHKNPSKPLNIANIIPQCDYCNQTYKNDFIFGDDGRIKAVFNPKIILKSPQKTLKAVFVELKKIIKD